jgi:hypothetical protein
MENDVALSHHIIAIHWRGRLLVGAAEAILEQQVDRSPDMDVDLHGFHPSQIINSGWFYRLVQQTWEMGESRLTLIHGHGRNRGISPGFVNTNTGYFGLCIRRALRHDDTFRQWILHTTLDCGQMGCTSVRLKANPSPTRAEIDCWPPEE